jgi:hypothetical protein
VRQRRRIEHLGCGRRLTLPLKAFERDGGVMLCSSFSKTLAPGLRIGWIAPGRHLKFVNTLTTPAFPQLTLAEFLAQGSYDRHLRVLRRAFANQVRQMIDAVTAHLSPGTKVTRPLGGFVVWVELPGEIDNDGSPMRLPRQAQGAGHLPRRTSGVAGRRDAVQDSETHGVRNHSGNTRSCAEVDAAGGAEVRGPPVPQSTNSFTHRAQQS